jgi:hypothetical protein
MNRLKVLQYNVQKSKKKVMAPLLADKVITSYDVLALQEPWQNPHKNATYCPSRSAFYVAYNDQKRRSCFLINKSLDINSWDIDYSGPDVCSLRLQLPDIVLWIHNFYNQSPGSHSTTDYPSSLTLLPDLLAREGEHLVLGDFNLHHPLWSGPRNPAAHKAAEPVVETLLAEGMELATPRGTITWEARGLSSTIDLAFTSQLLTQRLVECTINKDLDHSSDHFPISLQFELSIARTQPQPTRAWKKTDFDLVALTTTRELLPPGELSTPQQIDTYSDYLIDFTQRLVDLAVPWAKPSSFSVPWWTSEVAQAVKADREARHQWLDSGLAEDWSARLRASRLKRSVISKAQQKNFREAIAEAAEGGGVWRLAKWGRTKAHQPTELPVMPALQASQGLAYSVPEKAEALKARFYPVVEADLSDVLDTSFQDDTFQNSLEIPRLATAEEVSSLLQARKPYKAPGNDRIPNGFLRAMGPKLAEAVAQLANACWALGHLPARFKVARTVVLRKPGKPDYSDPGAWRPIALLNTIGKLIESLMAKRLSQAAEEHKLLPDTQMGARPGRSTETALELLTAQVKTVWGSGKFVASLLSLDISGAFDTVNPIRLLDTLRQKGFPGWVVRWVRAFMTDRETTLVIQGQETAAFPVPAGVPQGSPLSPILFLFYNSELLDLCQRPKEGLTAVGFADDVNMLAYSRSTETNCKILEAGHARCLDWARRHGMRFAPTKYELIHFTRGRKFNLEACVRLGDTEKRPSPDVRVLGVWLDTKLRWSAHLREVQSKASAQTGALTRITTSTWGASFCRARQVYSAVVRPALAYGAGIWHTPGTISAKGLAARLQPVQNKCLRTVAGAYRATPIRALETETHTPPLDLYLDSRLAAFRERLAGSQVGQTIQEMCKVIQRKLRNKRGRRRALGPVPGAALDEWARTRSSDLGKDTERKRMLEAWSRRWQATARPDSWDRVLRPPDPKVLKLHSGLRKAESSALVQFRTGCTGLARFLHKARVPGIESGLCGCGGGLETPRHVLVHCSKESERREELRRVGGGTLDFRKLLDTPEGTGVSSRWIVRSGRLHQFSLAKALLYE